MNPSPFISASIHTIKKKVMRATIDPLRVTSLLRDPASFVVIPDPFPHIVVDDVFTPEAYALLLRHFNAVRARGLSEEKDMNRFNPFLNLTGKYAYDGYVYAPHLNERGSANFFYSLDWNLFFSALFKQPTSSSTSMAYHFHPPGNKTGWVHNDNAPKFFAEADRLSNGVIYRSREEQSPTLIKERRIIALIYYLGNDEWREGDGGETGLYAEKEGAPVKLVAPKNNRLLAFHISPKSFHAFQVNRTPRSSIVQWFHIPDALAVAQYGEKK